MFLKDNVLPYKGLYYVITMSKLKVTNRDKAYKLFETLKSNEEECSLVNTGAILLDILKEIPCSNFKQYKKVNSGWETVAFVAASATLANIWDVPVGCIRDYMPKNEYECNEFQRGWNACLKNKKAEAVDFLSVIKYYEKV